MTRAIKLALALVALASTLCTGSLAEQFVDTSGAFSLEIIQGWKTQQSQDVLGLTAPNEISQMNVSKQDAQGVTLDVFASIYPEQMKKELNEFKLISSDKTTVDGAPAGVWVYTAKVDGLTLKFRNFVIFPKDMDVIYISVFATVTDLYDDDVSAYDTMMKSWTWSTNY